MRQEAYIEAIDGELAVDETIVLYGEDPAIHQLCFDTPTIDYVDKSPVKTIRFYAHIGTVAMKGSYSPDNGSGRVVRVVS